ncbi:MAG: tripartite tricarboxylate transporter substrate binding protein BugD, partial [Xanthobacteraceae bacterium]
TLLLAPANTPKEIVDKISAAFQQARESPDVKQKLNAIGQAVSTETPAESIAALRAEAQQWRRLIAERDIKFSQ